MIGCNLIFDNIRAVHLSVIYISMPGRTGRKYIYNVGVQLLLNFLKLSVKIWGANYIRRIITYIA